MEVRRLRATAAEHHTGLASKFIFSEKDPFLMVQKFSTGELSQPHHCTAWPADMAPMWAVEFIHLANEEFAIRYDQSRKKFPTFKIKIGENPPVYSPSLREVDQLRNEFISTPELNTYRIIHTGSSYGTAFTYGRAWTKGYPFEASHYIEVFSYLKLSELIPRLLSTSSPVQRLPLRDIEEKLRRRAYRGLPSL